MRTVRKEPATTGPMAAHPALNYLKSMLRIASRELRRREAPRLHGGERLVVERWGLTVDPRRLAAYLDVTGAARIARLHGPGALLPPLFAATWEAALAVELLCDPRAPSARRGVVHLASEVLQVRALRADETFHCRLEVERVEHDPRGVLLHLLTRTWNSSGYLGHESRSVLLVRGSAAAPRRGPPPAVDATPDAASEVRDLDAPVSGQEQIARWRLRANHGRRYARASGDYNPIHLSRLTALPFGFRRPLLHGFCTAALAAHALIEHRLGGDPARLRRLRITFRKPLLLPAEVLILASRPDAGAGRFRVVGAGVSPYAEGEFGGV